MASQPHERLDAAEYELGDVSSGADDDAPSSAGGGGGGGGGGGDVAARLVRRPRLVLALLAAALGLALLALIVALARGGGNAPAPAAGGTPATTPAAPLGAGVATGPLLQGDARFVARLPAGARAHHAAFVSNVREASIEAAARNLTAAPRLAGTADGRAAAETVAAWWRSYGISDVSIVPYDVLLAAPTSRFVAMYRPGHSDHVLTLDEPAIPGDAFSSDPRVVKTFNGYAKSGDVTGQLVYVHYCRHDDFVLALSLLARDGLIFRGTKVYLAQRFGAAGVLIYSDPIDDGALRGPVYPAGPWRPAGSVQRGSCSGDPQTPGYASVKGAPRIPEEQANIPSIPVQPISANDARPLVASLRGPASPDGWRGGLTAQTGGQQLPYPLGGTEDVRVRIALDVPRSVQTIYNVIARVPGAVDPDRVVVMGSHRDGWTWGAVDPTSSAQHEVVKGFGRLLAAGWRPRRTIIVASWDAEEQGLIGSTEWVEENAARLSAQAVVYLNVDIGALGSTFSPSATPSIAGALRYATRNVPDPAGGSVYDRWLAASAASDPASTSMTVLRNSTFVEPLGSGSDFTPFAQHLGVAALDMSFIGPYGVYHSAYDNFNFLSKIADPGFKYGATMAKVSGLQGLVWADSVLLPFDYADYALELNEYVASVVASVQSSTRQDVRSVDFTPLHQAAALFAATAFDLDSLLERIDASATPQALVREINDRLMLVEREFIAPRGLPQRNWYKHVIAGPSMWGGYAGTTFPSLQQAVADGDARELAAQVALASTLITNAARAVERVGATALS